MRRGSPNRTGHPRLNLLIYAAITAYALGQGMTIPALPLFAYSLGATETTLGLLGTMPSITYAGLAIRFGGLSEKRGRRAFIILGPTLYLLISLAYMISSNLNQILAVRPLEGISFALFWPCAEAYIADLHGNIPRRRATGYYTLAWSVGTTLGPAIGGYLIDRASIGSPFAACTIVMAISLILALISTNEMRSGRELTHDETGGQSTSLRSILFAILGYAFSQATVFSLYPVHASMLGFTEIEIGILLSLIGITRTLIFALFTFVRVPSGATMATFGYFILAMSLILMPILNWFYASAMSFAMMGAGLGLVYISVIGLVMNHQSRGDAAGAFESGIGIGAIAGPLISGIAAEHIGSLAPYFLSSFSAITGIVFAKAATAEGPAKRVRQ